MTILPYQPSQEKIITGEKTALLHYAETKGYLFISRDGKKITYTTQGFSYNTSDPKLYTRIRLYVDLIDVYGYSIDQIAFEVFLPENKRASYVDIVVYEDEEKKKPYIVIECKQEGILDAEFEKGVKQVIDSAHVLHASFAVCASGDRRRIIAIDCPSEKKRKDVVIDDLPHASACR